jgi:hypothetical protein
MPQMLEDSSPRSRKYVRWDGRRAGETNAKPVPPGPTPNPTIARIGTSKHSLNRTDARLAPPVLPPKCHALCYLYLLVVVPYM